MRIKDYEKKKSCRGEGGGKVLKVEGGKKKEIKKSRDKEEGVEVVKKE